MKSSKPYLIRAIYEWILDNDLTPYVAVDTTIPTTTVPKEYIENGRIILDISPTATSNLIISNEALECKARFSGISHTLYIPIKAIMIIYAQENNQGMAFPAEEFDNLAEEEEAPTTNNSKTSKSHLRLVTD